MTILQTWIHTPLAKALGWTLFHFLWEGAAIAALLLIALCLCRPAASRVRYALACLALLAMPVAFGITLAVSLPPAAPHFAVHPNVAPTEVWIAASAGPSVPPRSTLADRLAWAGPFWMAGVLGILLYRIANWMAAQRLRRVGTVTASECWRLRLESLVREAGIARSVALLESCLAEVPMVIGSLRPAILVPLGMLAGLPAEQVEAILLHELAHIRRADYLVNLMQIAIEGLLFYHPALWWVSGVVRAEREHCCNDWAAARLGNAHRYASALATLEESPWRAPRTAMAANGSNLLRRIRRLLAKPDARDLAVPVLPSMLLVISVGVALAAWSPDRPLRKIAKPDPAAAPVQLAQAPAAQRPRLVAQVQQMAPAPLQESGSTSSNDSMGWPYQRWLNEDVVYIITPEERSAFRKLLTDAEREQFIQQFWQRRDPTPATSQNEFKDEHYRRIAYANERFSSSDGRTPGWRTGRGRFYITYGPPDELDDHTNGDPNPYQIWQYRYIDGFGANVQLRFTIDPTGGSHLDQIVSPSPVATFEATANSGKARRSSVQIYPGGNVTFSIREDFSAGPFDSIGNIRTAQGTEVANFMDTGSQSDSLNRRSTFALAPGSYVFSMRLKDRSTGQIHNEEYPFEVK